MIGSVVTAAVQRWVGVGPTFAIGCVLFPAPLLLVPMAAARPLVLGMLFLAEFFSGMGVMMLDITGGRSRRRWCLPGCAHGLRGRTWW